MFSDPAVSKKPPVIHELLTDEDNVVIQLALVFSRITIQLRHVLQTFKHALDNALVSCVDGTSDLETIGATKLSLNALNVDGEVLDEVCDTVTFLRAELRLFNGLDLLVLEHY